MTVKIDYEKCCWKDGACTSCSCKGACKGCVEACPTGALERKKMIEVDDDKCIDCGACVAACEHDAICLC
ncbi:MAG: 4Fe-4S binding protein [Nanoarchaeota archaeon]|nr:4Fe-4S binding protein [Nanoarchaeota archaeon]